MQSFTDKIFNIKWFLANKHMGAVAIVITTMVFCLFSLFGLNVYTTPVIVLLLFFGAYIPHGV